MSVNLRKGQKINLSKENRGLSRVMVGLGWDEVRQSDDRERRVIALSDIYPRE